MARPEAPRFSVRPISHDQTTALRHAVLRPHQAIHEMVFEGDELAGTVHLGAFDSAIRAEQGGPIGVVTLVPAPMPDRPEAGDWRLRAMAVDPAHQGRGVGRLLVGHGIEAVRTQRGQRIWCYARSHAIGFYEKLGFRVDGETFHIPAVGPHVRMAIAVDPRPR